MILSIITMAAKAQFRTYSFVDVVEGKVLAITVFPACLFVGFIRLAMGDVFLAF